jgi:hypothetical protein
MNRPMLEHRQFAILAILAATAVMDLFEADYSVRIGRLTRRAYGFLRKITP